MENNLNEMLNTTFDEESLDALMEEELLTHEEDEGTEEYEDDENQYTDPESNLKNGEYEDATNHHQLLNDVPLKVIAEIAQVSLSINQLLALKIGSVIEMGKINQFIHLKANGNYFAQGILVDIDGRLGIKIINRLS